MGKHRRRFSGRGHAGAAASCASSAILFGGEAALYEYPRWPPHATSSSQVVGLVQASWIASTAHKSVARCLQRLRAGLDAFVAELIAAGGDWSCGWAVGGEGVADSASAVTATAVAAAAAIV